MGETANGPLVRDAELSLSGAAILSAGWGGNCKPYGRLNVRIDVDQMAHQAMSWVALCFDHRVQHDPHHCCTAALLACAVGGLLSTLPLELRLRGSPAAIAAGADLLRGSDASGGCHAGATLLQRLAKRVGGRAAGMDQAALEDAARRVGRLGEFEESEEDGVAVVGEFI